MNRSTAHKDGGRNSALVDSQAGGERKRCSFDLIATTSWLANATARRPAWRGQRMSARRTWPRRSNTGPGGWSKNKLNRLDIAAAVRPE
jgi:hypothetical protein